MSKLRMMDMTSGKLNKPLEFEHYVEAVDDLGQPVKTWVHFCRAWGKVEHLRGEEKWLAAQAQAEGTMTLEIRFIPSLAAKLRADIKLVRVKMEDRIFDIDSYRDPDEKRKRMHLDIKEVL